VQESVIYEITFRVKNISRITVRMNSSRVVVFTVACRGGRVG